MKQGLCTPYLRTNPPDGEWNRVGTKKLGATDADKVQSNKMASNVAIKASAIKTTSTRERTGTLNHVSGATRFDVTQESMDRVKHMFAHLKRHAGKGYLCKKGNTELVGD